MEQTNDEKLLSEMNGFISENSVSSGTDDDDLPFEPFDAFSTAPVEFGEMAERMLGKVENLFDLTRVYNRHSKKYLKAFGLLERGIRLLGSVCVTRTALKDHGRPLPELGQLTTAKLYGMASFNYRKLDTALSERLAQRNDLYPELTDALFRCFTLLGRLRATERKIHKYFTDKYHDGEDYKPMIEGLAFSEKSWTKCYYPKNEEAPAFRSAPAYPVLKEELKVTAPKKTRTFAEPSALPAPKAGKEAAAETETRLQAAQPAGAADETAGDRGCHKEAAMAPAVKIGPQPCITAAAEIPDEAKQPEEPAEGNPPSTETPACVEIVKNAVIRGSVRRSTDKEILTMTADTFPDRVIPDMADWVKKMAEKIGDG